MNPGADNPFSQMGMADPGIRISPKIQHFVDLGVEIWRIQLLGGGAVETTWP
jgi:hypothetical protein